MGTQDIKAFLLTHIPDHPKNIVGFAEKSFGVTRTTIHRHLSALIAEEKVFKQGTTSNTTYLLQSPYNRTLSFPADRNLSESDIWAKNFGFLRQEIPDNIYTIVEHGFTEMFNNAKDHSEGTKIFVHLEKVGNVLKIRVADNGVGIFRKIKDAFEFSDERESVLQLSKGKLTTDPENHSGEGIFFSSRAFDSFAILASGLAYIRDNQENDWFVESREDIDKLGTLFTMEITVSSERDLRAIFQQYANPESHVFDKTHILVNLSKANEERFVSRSQAKRIVFGLEKFKRLILDFKGVQAVGQAFVDEVFRVFKNKHPEVTLDIVNANDDIKFMIQRGIATGAQSTAVQTPGGNPV